MSDSESFAFTGRITGSKSHHTSSGTEFRMLSVDGVNDDAGAKRLIKIWPKKKDSDEDQPWLKLVGEAVFDGTVPLQFKGYSEPKNDKPDERWYTATKVEAIEGDTNPVIERARAAAADPEPEPAAAHDSNDWGAPPADGGHVDHPPHVAGGHLEHSDHHLSEELDQARRSASDPRRMPAEPTELRLGDREFAIVSKLVANADRRERTAEGLAVLDVLMRYMPNDLLDGDDAEARVKWLEERAPGLLRFARSISRKADESNVTA